MSVDFKQFTFPILLATSLSVATFPAMGEWLVRGRIINIAPDSNSDDATANSQTVPNSTVSVDNASTLDIDITYMFAPNLGVELLLDLSSRHDISSEGVTLRRLAPGNIMSTRVLPPALILQYHFAPDGIVRPYAGLGLNYTYFFDEEATASLDEGLGGVSDVSLDSSFGWVGQVGIDYEIGNDWFLNADFKYMDIDTTATFHSGTLGNMAVNVEINPWVVGLGIGKRF